MNAVEFDGWEITNFMLAFFSCLVVECIYSCFIRLVGTTDFFERICAVFAVFEWLHLSKILNIE